MTGTALTETRRARVLIVDDEFPNRRLLISMLKQEGYEIIEAENGRRAVAIIQEEPIDVVLLDVMMPVLDGIETCRVVRQELNKPLLPIVMITALADHASRARAKAAGVDDFITKPVYKDELLARVRALLHVQRLHEEIDERRRLAEADARRWRLVSRVANHVATANTFEGIKVRIVDLLEGDFPIDEIDCGFVGDAAGESDVSAKLLALIGRSRAGEPNTSGTLSFEQEADGCLFLPLATAVAFDGGLLIKPRTAASATDRLLLDGLAPHLGNAIARVRLLRANEHIAQSRDRLAAMLAHDFKSPLSVIKMNLEMIRSTVAFEDQDAGGAIDDSVTASDQILRMVLDLIDINRAEGGLLPFSPQVGDLGAVVRAATAPFARIVEQAGARLVFGISPQVRAAAFDEALIVRVLQNLLVNAARFVQRGGVVEVGTVQDADGVAITVANDGPPIAAERRQAIFRKYGMVSDDAQTANRGLGLHLCALVIERHGGTISVDDRVGGGVSFTIRLRSAL